MGYTDHLRHDAFGRQPARYTVHGLTSGRNMLIAIVMFVSTVIKRLVASPTGRWAVRPSVRGRLWR